MTASRALPLNAALLIVYFIAGKFSLSFFGIVHPSASAVWFPTGVAMAAFLLGGLRLLPAVFVGAFLVNVTTAGSIGSSLGVALGNTLEGVLAATLLERFAGGRNAFSSASGLLKFLALAALLSTAVSATIGVESLTLAGLVPDGDYAEIWFTWWLGDAAGAVLVTPLVVLWCADPFSGWSARSVRYFLLVLAATGLIGGAVFFHPALTKYPLAFLCLAPLTFGALRFGPREIAAAVALLAVVATVATWTGQGPLVMDSPNESLLVLQAFLALIAMTTLPMAALTAERRALLTRERDARAEADAASRAKDEFVAIVSHELRNPLAAISTAAAVLDTGQPPADLRQLVGTIRRQAQHLARLIDDLLDIGRMTANKLTLQIQPVNLARIVCDCVDALVATRGLAPGRIELNVEPAWIDADPVRIAQIVENLLGNALKHTPPGKGIHVTVTDIGSVAELRVADEGFGIPPELLPTVFEPFTQGEQGLERSAGGLGLGLTLVRRLVELHEGTIEARSAGVDRGSEFIVRLPARDVPADAPAEAAVPNLASARARRLLVVEDNVDARNTLRTLLELLGHEVHEAADGEAGVAAALALEPELVFIDIGLPRLDGYEVARRLRAANASMRLVALTGYGRDDDLERARAAGFDEHLLKPASIEQLRAAIDAAA